MTRKEWMQEHHPNLVSSKGCGGVFGCPHNYSELVAIDPLAKYCVRKSNGSYTCSTCWNAKIPNGVKENEMIKTTINNDGNVEAIEAGPHILDSGDRTEFESGAVRDMRKGKGRCDLLPLNVVATMFNDTFFNYIEDFQQDGDVTSLYRALDFFSKHWMPMVERLGNDDLKTESYAEMCLEVAKHFEEGAKKYGDNNWRRGIPVYCYIDSAVRHYLKFLAGWTDEPHDRAVAWNLMCCIWTCDNLPALNDYAPKTPA